MKPRESWAFSCPLPEVNLHRIIREAKLSERGGVVLINVGGKAYTLWRRHDYPDYVPEYMDYVYRESSFARGPRTSTGRVKPEEVGLLGHLYDYDQTGIVFCRGDHVGKLLDRVETTVQVF